MPHPLAIELDDRAVSIARAGEILSSSPSAVWDGSTDESAGTTAWNTLRRHPTSTSTRHLGTLLGSGPVANERALALVASELAARLTARAPMPGESVWIVAPARVSESGLGAVLAIARNLSLSVGGFVDSSVASVAALGIESSAIVLELGLHHAAATFIDRAGAQVRRRRTVATQRGGLMGFYQAWLELVSTTMVKQTRFDPLYYAATEQSLFDSLPAWAREVAVGGAVRAALTHGTQRFEVALTRDQFAQAARSSCREITRLLHELRPAGAPITLVAPSAVAELPGLRDELEQFVDCELIGLPDGFAAAATSLLDLPEQPSEQAARLLRRLPAQQKAVSGDVTRIVLGKGRPPGARPSHLLLQNQVYALGGEPLVLGRSPAGTRTLTLPDGIAGVSRRHCTFIPVTGEVVLLDHSSFGTFVNGERVVERVRVRAGDQVRLGDPGIEIALLAIGAATDGAPADASK